MKRYVLLMPILAAFVLNSCFLARIVTVAPEPVVATSTTVYVPQQKVPATTTTVQVNPTTNDISLYLDLRAIGAAFGQASTVQEFEMMLNSSQYMLSNLDLNHDGYVDYLRVMEVMEGYNHVLVIQAVLARNIYQDVATIVVERGVGYGTPYVQIIGHTYIYGRNYIIEPVYYREPPMFAHLRRSNYAPWCSPYVWGAFPSYYRQPAPVYLSHYQAYVVTYMDNHRYCHEVYFADSPHYVDYVRVSQPVVRQDYAQSNPQGSFVVRNAGRTNTRDISMTASTNTGASSRTTSTGSSSRTSVPASTSTTTRGTATTSATTATSTAASTRGISSTTTTPTATSSRTSAPSSASTTTSRGTSTSTVTTTTSSRTATTPAAASTRTTTTVATSPSRSATTTVSSSATPTRAASTTTTTSRTATSAAPTSTRTASATTATTTRSTATSTATISRTTTPSTTVTSRVNASGTARTQTRTVSASGTTTTSTRGTTSSTSTSTRGTATSTRR